MFMNIIVVIFVLGIAYAWTVRGVFNSLIHAMCVFFGGVIAFALWEPLAYLLLGLSDSPIVEGMAWGTALIVPFVLATLGLRVVTDKLIKANIKNVKAIDYAGAAVFGLASSVITAGVLVIGIGYMRLPSTFLGYQPVWYADGREGAGSLVKTDSLWIPVDTLTAKMYSNVSMGSMGSADPLAKWYPDLTLTGFAARISPGDGSGRNAITEDAFKVLAAYQVGNTNGSTEKDQTLEGQGIVDIDGEKPGAGYLAGYVVEFGPGAKEKGGKGGGQVVISNGQIRLLTEDKDGNTRTIFPLAAISESSTQGQYGRWVFDSEDLFITSTGGKSRFEIGFEFFVPADETPVALYVKNIRVPVDSIEKPREFKTASERKRLIQTGSLLTGKRVKRSFDLSKAVVVDGSSGGTQTDAVFGDRIGTILSSQIAKQNGLKINDKKLITEGSATFRVEDVGRKNAPQDKNLRVDKFTFGKDQQMVRVNVGSEAKGGLLSEAANNASSDEPFMLIDVNGNEYEAVGYVYEDDVLLKIRYTPGSTLSGLDESGLPRISRSKDGQQLSLVFLISNGVEIEYFTIGDVVLVHYDPALGTD